MDNEFGLDGTQSFRPEHSIERRLIEIMPRLERIASKRVRRNSGESDASDIAISAARTVLRRYRDPNINFQMNELWDELHRAINRKAKRHDRRAAKSVPTSTFPVSSDGEPGSQLDISAAIADTLVDPGFALLMEELFDVLQGHEPQVAVLRVGGLKRQEIADELDISLRMVDHVLAKIRTKWAKQLTDNEASD